MSTTQTEQTESGPLAGVIWRGADRLIPHLVPIGDLRPFPGNPEKGLEHIQLLVASLTRFGQVRPVLVREDGVVVAGNHLRKAAIRMGWTHMAAIPHDFPEMEDVAYNVADNRLTEVGVRDGAAQMNLVEAIGDKEGTGWDDDDVRDLGIMAMYPTVYVPADDLTEHDQHYAEHPDDQLEHLMESLLQHGFYRNVVVAKDGTILAGHGIVKAAKLCGISKIPTTQLDVDPDSPEALKILAGDNTLGLRKAVDDRGQTELLKAVLESADKGLLGTGLDEQMLAGLVLVTRRKHEIADIDEAAHWVGLSEWDGVEAFPYRLVVHFEYEEVREDFVREQLGNPRLQIGRKGTRAWSLRWPPTDKQEDLGALRFDFEEGAAE